MRRIASEIDRDISEEPLAFKLIIRLRGEFFTMKAQRLPECYGFPCVVISRVQVGARTIRFYWEVALAEGIRAYSRVVEVRTLA
jgi:hypothetical protein